MADYMKYQLRVIERYARFLHQAVEEVAMDWASNGMAKRFAVKHREEFGMVKEG